MNSFIELDATFDSQPRRLGPVLARIDTGRGRERLFEDQRPELLRALSEDARVASIKASNEIEGVTIDADRAEQIAAQGTRRFRNRNEREFAGYRDVIDMMMRLEEYEPLKLPFVLHLHRQLFAHSATDGGQLKSAQNLIANFEEGQRDVVFKPTPPERTEFMLTELFARYEDAKRSQQAHPIVLIGAMVLDFLAIHPFDDGNGRLARLLTTYELLAQGYRVARYVSLEQRIFDSKNTYYATLYESQRDWHQSNHTIWPWVQYLCEILAGAYDDFEQRVAAASEQTGSKQDRVRDYVLQEAPAQFRRRDIERALPEVSIATIRLVLNELRDAGSIKAEGSGQGARWGRLDSP